MWFVDLMPFGYCHRGMHIAVVVYPSNGRCFDSFSLVIWK